MNTDIRVATSFRTSRKRKRLDRIIGHPSAGYVIDIWIEAAISRPEGILTGWTEADIEIEAGWQGGGGVLAKALVEVGFLELEDGTFKLHDWKEHQVWACGARKRSEAARKAADARWEKKYDKKGENGGCDRSAPAMRTHQSRNAPILSFPLPPFPTLKGS